MAERCFSADEALEITTVLAKFRNAHGEFSRSIVVSSRNVTQLVEWWRLFGGEYPLLQKLVVRILSQTGSSSGSERNWSVFERIYTKRRNRLEHQRLNDRVFVHYNLRLQNRLKMLTDPMIQLITSVLIIRIFGWLKKSQKGNLIMMSFKGWLMSKNKSTNLVLECKKTKVVMFLLTRIKMDKRVNFVY